MNITIHIAIDALLYILYIQCILIESLDDEKPQGDIALSPLRTFLPSKESCRQLRDDFIVLISRVLVQRIPVFYIFKDIVPSHIPHKYSREMLQASEIVSFVCKCLFMHVPYNDFIYSISM